MTECTGKLRKPLSRSDIRRSTFAWKPASSESDSNRCRDCESDFHRRKADHHGRTDLSLGKDEIEQLMEAIKRLKFERCRDPVRIP